MLFLLLQKVHLWLFAKPVPFLYQLNSCHNTRQNKLSPLSVSKQFLKQMKTCIWNVPLVHSVKKRNVTAVSRVATRHACAKGLRLVALSVSLAECAIGFLKISLALPRIELGNLCSQGTKQFTGLPSPPCSQCFTYVYSFGTLFRF